MSGDTLEAWVAQATIPELAAALTRVSARLLEFQGNVPPGAPLDGEGLKALRHDLALTQEQTARILGVTLRTISRWEIGMCRLDPLRGAAARQRLYEAARTREHAGVR